MAHEDGLVRIGQELGLARQREGKRQGMILLAERLLWVRDREGKARRLRANAVQRQFEQRRGRLNIVLKARQMGLTTWIAGRFLLKTLTQRGVLSVQVAHTREAAEAIFGVVQRMWENLPADMRSGPLRRTKATAGRMVFGALDSEFRVVSAGEKNAGRGLTIQNLHLSEMARWPGDASATLADLRAALAPGGEMTIESTANGAYGAFYEEWMRAQESGAGENGIVRHFFPWWLEPAYVAEAAADASEEEAELMRVHGLTTHQIGFRRNLERSFRALRQQEFAEDATSCFRVSGDGMFDVDSIERRMLELPTPMAQRRGGALLVWLPALPGKEYLVAVDTAGGGAGGDYAAIQVIELASGLQCAELREKLGTLELARMAAAVAREFNGAMIAVERNNHGAGVLAYLDSAERYARVYEQGGTAGWLTSAGSKPAMVSRIGVLLEESPEIFLSARLLEECRTFCSFSGGRTGAAPGAHDDCFMSMAVAQAVRAERLGQR